MSISRLPMFLATVVALFKLVTILAMRLGPHGVAATLLPLVMADIPSWQAAETTAGMFSDPRRLGPMTTEALLFDLALVLFTCVEWYVVGWVVRRALQRRR